MKNTKTLSASKVTLTTQILTRDLVNVSNSHTSYGNEHRMPLLDPKAILATYKKVFTLAKAANVSISYKMGCKRQVNETKVQYIVDMAQYNGFFDNMLSLWEDKLIKGIFTPTCDDDELNAIYTVRNKCNPYNYRSSVTSNMTEIKNHLDNLLVKLQSEHSLVSITL